MNEMFIFNKDIWIKNKSLYGLRDKLNKKKKKKQAILFYIGNV
jgi:hypothetical protein